jgi:membrane protease subunit (stomatin/prohibitin family)
MTTIFDLTKKYDTLSEQAHQLLLKDFKDNGLELVNFYITSITLPEETSKIIDETAGMNAIDNMNKYMQFKAAKSMEEAAKNQGGAAGAGVGMGAGIGLGMNMAKKFENLSENDVPKILPAERLKQLKDLLDSGSINQEEFDLKKKQIINEL